MVDYKANRRATATRHYATRHQHTIVKYGRTVWPHFTNAKQTINNAASTNAAARETPNPPNQTTAKAPTGRIIFARGMLAQWELPFVRSDTTTPFRSLATHLKQRIRQQPIAVRKIIYFYIKKTAARAAPRPVHPTTTYIATWMAVAAGARGGRTASRGACKRRPRRGRRLT